MVPLMVAGIVAGSLLLVSMPRRASLVALGASIAGLLAAALPEKIRSRIPLALAWIVPVVLLPLLLYSLKFYWRWE